jgi:type I restriction enzyme S subunit
MSTKAQQVRPEVETPDTELPEGWLSVRLPETCEINPPKPSAEALPASAPVTFVPMPAVDADLGAITRAEARPFSKVRKGYTSFADDDVIMAKITPCMENGKAAIARHLQNGLGFGSTEFHVFRSNGAVLPEYLYNFIRQDSFRRAAENEMTGSVGQKRVPVEFLENSEIPLPPVAEQERILDKLNALITQTRSTRTRLEKIPALIKYFRQAVLAAACSGKLTDDWRDKNSKIAPADRLAHKISTKRESEALEIIQGPREIPETWIWVAFGSLIGELKNGISTKPEIEPPGKQILRISAVRAGKVILDDCRYLRTLEDFSAYGLHDGDLLFTRYNGSLELLGVCGMVRGLEDALLLYPDKLMRARFDHPWVLPAYAEIFFGSPTARERIIGDAVSSAGQQGISGAKVKTQPFAFPPLEEQAEIVRRIEALFKLADAIEKRVAAASLRAERMTQAVLAKAFRGELVPTEAELARQEGREYEPAFVLLERIKKERAANVKSQPKRKRKAADRPILR